MAQEYNNYIYLMHLDEYLYIPEYPDSIPDSMQSQFQATNALSRTAPVFSYSYSGPRTVQVKLKIHRDMLDDLNISNSVFKLKDGEDYTDALIRKIQAIALPSYNATSSSIVPPMVALKMGNQLFIKGIVTGTLSVDYSKPILDNDKYAIADINFTIYEVEPFDAYSVAQQGSFRGITRQFKNNIF